MPEKLVIHCLVGCPLTLRVLFTAFAVGANPTIKWYHHKWQLKTEEYKRNNHELASGLVETEHGNLTDSPSIMRYLARLDTKQNLYGKTNFERAQIDMCMAETQKMLMTPMKGIYVERGMAPGSSKDVMSAYNQTPVAMKAFEDRLGKQTYLVGENMTIADINLASLLLSNRGTFLPDSIMKRMPNISKWWNHMRSQSFFTRLFGKTMTTQKVMNVPAAEDLIAFKADPANDFVNIARAKQGLPEPKQPEATTAQPEAPKKLTGKAAAQAKIAAEKAKKEEAAGLGPKKKGPVIAKSSVVFDVKGYEEGQDFEALAKKIRAEVNMDGLVWMDRHQVLPIAFGMKKLQMTMLIEDEKVQTDDVFELIEAWEDEVQSTDIFAFNKA